MMKSYKTVFLAIVILLGVSIKATAQMPLWMAGYFGLGLPDGGKHFNSDFTHYPGPVFTISAQTPWNDNWFLLDSLIVGAEFSISHFNARDIRIEQNLTLKTLYVNFSRNFTYGNFQPFCNLCLGISTLNTSERNFVFSLGGAIRVGGYFLEDKVTPGFSIGYNAPMIAYRNTLTGYWEISFCLRGFSQINFKKKNAPSFQAGEAPL